MTVFPDALLQKATAILAVCKQQGFTIATAESCTGGLLSSLLTELPGSATMFTHGFITYANEAKSDMLGVSADVIQEHGAVSEPVARAMAEGALKNAHANLAIAITGIAGPDGGSDAKPTGTVHFACAVNGKATTHQMHVFTGERSKIRLTAVEMALNIIGSELKLQALLFR